MTATSSARAVARQVARELSLPRDGVAAALALFDEGNTLPFVARYRKERTGGLDEVQLREVRERARYLAELEDRRATVLASIDERCGSDPTPDWRLGWCLKHGHALPTGAVAPSLLVHRLEVL